MNKLMEKNFHRWYRNTPPLYELMHQYGKIRNAYEGGWRAAQARLFLVALTTGVLAGTLTFITLLSLSRM